MLQHDPLQVLAISSAHFFVLEVMYVCLCTCLFALLKSTTFHLVAHVLFFVRDM